MKGLFFIAVLFGTIGIAAAQNSPAPPAKTPPNQARIPLRLLPTRLPRPRPSQPMAVPEQYGAPQEAYAAFPDRAGAGGRVEPSACQLRLEQIATFKPLPVLVGPGECGATDAVALENIILPDKTSVALTPAATLRCTMAEAIAAWVRDDVAPAALKLGTSLRGIDNFDSYECRGRNRVRGATLSEHGRANALDIRGFKLANGDMIRLTDVNVARDWREGVRASACARFSTVLGPGSDGNHEDHIHLDLADRHGGYKTCEWDVREPAVQAAKAEPAEKSAAKLVEDIPLPRPRPVPNVGEDARNRKTRAQE